MDKRGYYSILSVRTPYEWQMRIIAGTKRGMKLFSPKTQESRPITDRVKESLFSVLYKYDLPDGSPRCVAAGKMVADLFCGVGSLGLEALSRGAEFVTFVEKDPKIIEILEKNIEKGGFVKESPLGDTAVRRPQADLRWKVIRADVFKIGAPVDEQKYDLAFVDPPYSTTRDVRVNSPLGGLLTLLEEQLAPDGIVVVRTERHTELLERYGQLEIIERRQWGTMAVTILQRTGR